MFLSEYPWSPSWLAISQDQTWFMMLAEAFGKAYIGLFEIDLNEPDYIKRSKIKKSLEFKSV